MYLIDDILLLFVSKLGTKESIEKITVGNNNKHIQILTYIILLFLQSIAPLSEEMNISDDTIKYIIERLNKIVEEEKNDNSYSSCGSDFRNFLFVFYSDLLDVICDPLFPVAEKVLIIYLNVCSAIIKEDKYINSIHLKILAKICDCMQMLKDRIDLVEIFPKENNNEEEDEGNDAIYNCCNETIINYNIKSDIKCVKCNKIFHRKCLYLSETTNEWKCKKCSCYETAIKEIETVKNMINNETIKKRTMKKEKYTNTLINRQILLHYVTYQYYQYNSIEYRIARNYYLYEYSHEDSSKQFKFYDYMKNTSNLPQFFITDILNENDIVFYILQLMRGSLWLKCKNMIVFILNKSLGSQYPKIRAEAIKGIRTVIENNANRVSHDILTV